MTIRILASFSLLLTTGLLATTAAVAQSPARAGINLSGPADWSTELPFADVFRLSRQWISQRQGESWGKGPKLELDERGWVKQLEPNCWAETPICTIEGGHYPAGEYTVLYTGKGKLAFTGAAKIKSSEPGRIVITVDPRRGGFFLQLRETDPADPVRDIRVLMPGAEKAIADNPWNPQFLETWRGMASVRFMDLMETNGSHVATWADRPRPDDATFTAKGVPVELLVDLANRLQADPWFCMPHLADDEYVRNFAQVVKAKLDPNRKVYIEYSNEVWNGQFPQHRYAAEQGQKLKLADKPWEAAWLYTAHRSLEIFAIWEDVFGGRERLVRVLPSQAANPYISERITSYKDAAKHADALAIAPYLSLNLGPMTKPSAPEVAGWSLDQVFTHLRDHSLPESTRWIQDNKKVADKHGLALLAYEGGQHLVGIQGAENNDQLTKLLHAANADPRMGKLYDAYLAAWQAEGGGLFCHFSSVGQWSKWGSWGLLQSLDEDRTQSPKHAAFMRWARSLGQEVNLNDQ